MLVHGISSKKEDEWGENYPTGILIDVIFRLANNKILTVQKQISEVTL